MLEDSSFAEVVIGDHVDTFGGATGEDKARTYEVYGYAFLARKVDLNLRCGCSTSDRTKGEHDGC
jgi:hypothetical protein